MIAANLSLPVPRPLGDVLAQVPAGHLPQHSALYVGNQIGVLYQQVRYQPIPLPADLLYMPPGVVCVVLRPYLLRRVALGYVLALKTGHCRRFKDVLRVPVDHHHPLRVPLQPQFPGQIFLWARPGNGHIPANEIPLRRSVHVGTQLGTIVGKQMVSPPNKNGAGL